MATLNPFDLLGDDDAEDPSQLIAAQKAAAAAVASSAQPKKSGSAQPKKSANAPAQLPSKPAPPSQAVREARSEGGRGGGRGGGGGRGYGRGGGRGGGRDFINESSYGGGSGPVAGEGEPGKPYERRGPRGSFRGGAGGGRRGGFSNGESVDGERPRRVFERRSGTGRGSEMKRGGAGSGNWGTPNDELAEVTEGGISENEKNMADEKPAGEGEAGDANKENVDEPEEKEPEDKEMTLEEYEKVLEEKRKALQALKPDEGRKVDAKEFESMQLLSNKKGNDEVFVKLGSQKDKRREAAEKDEKAKKSVSINEFLKPAEGEGYYRMSGRGRGRGRGARGYGAGNASNAAAPAIEDPGQFPTLGGK